MKKFQKISLTTLLLLILTISAVFALISCKDNGDDPPADKGAPIVTFVKPENDTPYLIKTYADGSQCEEDFKIVTFGDAHFNGNKESAGDAVSLTLIENTLKQEKPDLVVFVGDNCLGKNAAQAIINLGQLFEKYTTYWGYVLGNHDGESSEGPQRSELPALYAAFEHCIIDPVDEISGEGNCIVNVKNTGGEVVQSLVFIDTGDYVKEELCEDYGFTYEKGYDFIKRDQIEWYKSSMNAIAAKNGKMPKSIMFTHIPLKEYLTAYKTQSVIYGVKLEDVCASPFNTGMFDAIIEIGSTKAVVSGHDHTNDFCVDYQGVKLIYSQSTAYNSYIMRNNLTYRGMHSIGVEVKFNDGHTEFKVNLKGDLTITQRYNQDNPSLFDGLSDEHRKELFLDETLPK